MYGIWNIATQRFLIGICERTKAEAEAKYIAKYPIASTLLDVQCKKFTTVDTVFRQWV